MFLLSLIANAVFYSLNAINIILYKVNNKDMEDPKVIAAVKHYEAVKKASTKYYSQNKEKINERRRVQYRGKNPNPKPRGRPKKNIVVENNNELPKE